MTADLIKKLGEATEGSRELDGEIARALFPYALIMTDAGQVGRGARPATYEPIGTRVDLPGDVIAECTGVPFYTTSLDAALALAGRVLPGWTVAQIGQDDARGWFVELREGYQTSFSRVAMSPWPRQPTPALALCLAILSAQQKEPKT